MAQFIKATSASANGEAYVNLDNVAWMTRQENRTAIYFVAVAGQETTRHLLIHVKETPEELLSLTVNEIKAL